MAWGRRSACSPQASRSEPRSSLPGSSVRVLPDRRRGRRRGRRDARVAQVLRDPDVRRAGQTRPHDRDRHRALHRGRGRGRRVSGAAGGRAIGASVVLGATGAAAAVTRPASDLTDASLDRGSCGGCPDLALAHGRGRAPMGSPRAHIVAGDAELRPETVPPCRRRGRGDRAAAGGLGRLLSSRATAAASRAAARIPAPADIGPPPPAGADLGVPGVEPFLTPNASFYRVDTALFVPAVDAESWTLRVHGMVDREIALGFDDLLARLRDRARHHDACVSNEVGGPYVGNALDRRAPRRPPPRGRRPSRCLAGRFTVRRRIHGRPPTAVVMDGRGRDARRLDERRAPAAGARVPVRMLVPGSTGTSPR